VRLFTTTTVFSTIEGVASAPGAIIGPAANASELSKASPATRLAVNSTVCNVFIFRFSLSKVALSKLRLETCRDDEHF
jgi:hypothetical protein